MLGDGGITVGGRTGGQSSSLLESAEEAGISVWEWNGDDVGVGVGILVGFRTDFATLSA